MPRLPSDPAAFERDVILADIERFASITTKRAWGWEYIDPWQRRLLKCEDRYIWVNASRQSGKSSTLMVKTVHGAITNPNSLSLILAKQEQADEDMRKCKDIYNAYNDYLKERYGGVLVLELIEDNKHTMEFAHRARIKALAATERSRGYSAPLRVTIDEARDVPDEAFVAINPMLIVSQGQLILGSTPGGTSGFFSTERQNPRYVRFVVPYTECPRISRDEIEIERQIYGDAYIKQEYSCIFLDEISAVFTEKALNESMDDTEEPMLGHMAHIQKMIKGEAELI